MFPDSLALFAPFEYTGKTYFPTRTRQGRSLDRTMAVEDGDVVMVPRGYHPVGAPHGYDLYYLNVMAGPKRQWIFRNDPAHDWIARKA